MISTPSALASNVKNTADKLGVPLPPAFVAAVEQARALPPGAEQLNGSGPELHAAALAALAAGNDPADDKTVQRLAIHHALSQSGLRAAAEELAGDRIAEALRQHADEIIDGWSKSVQSDLDTLTNAAKVLNLDDLDHASPVLLKRAGTLNTWAEATSAAERVDAALAGLRAIFTALHVPHSFAVNALMLAPDANLSTVSAVASANRQTLKSWQVARIVGGPLRLSTVSEFVAGVARLNEDVRTRDAEADKRAAEEAKHGRSRTWQRVS